MPERRSDPHGEDWRHQVDEQLQDLGRQMQTNTQITAEVREILDAVRGGIKVLGWLGRLAKWATPIVGFGAAVVALVSALKTGSPK